MTDVFIDISLAALSGATLSYYYYKKIRPLNKMLNEDEFRANLGLLKHKLFWMAATDRTNPDGDFYRFFYSWICTAESSTDWKLNVASFLDPDEHEKKFREQFGRELRVLLRKSSKQEQVIAHDFFIILRGIVLYKNMLLRYPNLVKYVLQWSKYFRKTFRKSKESFESLRESYRAYTSLGQLSAG